MSDEKCMGVHHKWWKCLLTACVVASMPRQLHLYALWKTNIPLCPIHSTKVVDFLLHTAPKRALKKHMHLIIDGTNQLKNKHAAQVRIATSQTFATKFINKCSFVLIKNNIFKVTDDPNKYAYNENVLFLACFF